MHLGPSRAGPGICLIHREPLPLRSGDKFNAGSFIGIGEKRAHVRFSDKGIEQEDGESHRVDQGGVRHVGGRKVVEYFLGIFEFPFFSFPPA